VPARGSPLRGPPDGCPSPRLKLPIPLGVCAVTQRWLVRFGYDGRGFFGWARQPGRRTIEGALREGLRARGIFPSPNGAVLEVASRTDRAVSARANALTLRSAVPAESLLRRLNTITPELFFTAASPVSPEFRVRGAQRRTYRYFDPSPASAAARWEPAAALMRGPIDVRSFGRGVRADRPQWRVLESVTVEPWEGGLLVEVRAPSFVWGMVRKIVGALREVGAGRLAMRRLQAALTGAERLTLPLAEPEGLVLWDLEYPSISWDWRWDGPNRHQERFLRGPFEEPWRRHAVLGATFEPVHDLVSGLP